MNVMQVPVVPIPNIIVLRELTLALQERAATLRSVSSQETDPKYLTELAARAGSIAFLEEQVRKIQFLTSPTIDIIVADPPKPEEAEKPNPQT